MALELPAALCWLSNEASAGRGLVAAHVHDLLEETDALHIEGVGGRRAARIELDEAVGVGDGVAVAVGLCVGVTVCVAV